MIKEPRNRELTREDVYAEYFSRLADQEHRCVDSVFYDRMKEVNGIFKGKTQLELMIKGAVYFDKDYKKFKHVIPQELDATKENVERIYNTKFKLKK